jgi:hypothetical protein
VNCVLSLDFLRSSRPNRNPSPADLALNESLLTISASAFAEIICLSTALLHLSWQNSHKKQMKHLLLLTIALTIGMATINLCASGSYTRQPSPPPASKNMALYNLGKLVYAGKAAPAAKLGNAEIQSARLKELQGKLPKSARKSANLPALGGKLSTDQMIALEHFLEVRYRIK